MKVYLPAIAEYVSEDMVQAIQAFLDFCYIARRNVHTEQTLDALQDALDRFHYYRKIFETCGIDLTVSHFLGSILSATSTGSQSGNSQALMGCAHPLPNLSISKR
ncbi:hypothetical protein BKA93DRAFT_215735 [Sparassis latifolia]